MSKFILFIIILAAVTGIVGFWYSQKNVYSKDIIKLEILEPTEAELGAEIEYIVKYKNNGKIRVEDPELIFEYPEHTILKQGESLRQRFGSEYLGDAIYPGDERNFYFSGRLLGEEGEAKIARAWLSYRPKNLKARYESKTTFTTIIKKVPLVLEFDLSTKIQPEKEFRFQLNYFSNVEYLLSDLRCILEYPSNFEFLEAAPVPTFEEEAEKAEWEIPYLNPAEGGRLEISGRFHAEIGEKRTFNAQLGIWQEGEFILLKEAVKGVSISRPSLYISQQINGNPKYIASAGDRLHYEIFFKNIGEEPLIDMFLVAKLDSRAFDFQTLKSTQGEFELGDSSIIWDKRQVSKLRFLDAHEEGKVEFWINLKEDWDFVGSEDKNLVLRNKIILNKVREEFLTKVNSKLEVEQRCYFEDEIFGNSGLIPPKYGETTTYTVIWQAKNFYNPVKNVKIKAILPKEVKPTGKIFPEDSRITFDSQSREMVWKINEIEPGEGILTDKRTCAFQIVLTPAHNQKGEPALLINQAKILGRDEWTEEILEALASSTDTTLPDDQTISWEMGIVR